MGKENIKVKMQQTYSLLVVEMTIIHREQMNSSVLRFHGKMTTLILSMALIELRIAQNERDI